MQYVQFSDATETTVTAVFGGPQDPAAYPNQASVADTDPRYLAFANPTATLAGAQAAQTELLAAACAVASTAPVTYTSRGGVTRTYPADTASVAALTSATMVYQSAGAVPDGFYRVATDGTPVPFILADLGGLAQAISAQAWSALQHLQAQKSAVLAATTIAAVQAIVW